MEMTRELAEKPVEAEMMLMNSSVSSTLESSSLRPMTTLSRRSRGRRRWRCRVAGGAEEGSAEFFEALVVGEHGEGDLSEGSEEPVGEDAVDLAVAEDFEVLEGAE
ncbi:hypothetical protein [Mucisphaera calidilacus]|uniref:hypothetical protein n=1 Tax=Mucisphaera calidilacus TaxID=2527982 RepID=UPI001F45EFFB|nr:hypothetical protein [Mucisphaera calidilacus]